MNGIDELYEQKHIQKVVTRNKKKDYYLKVRQKTYNDYGISPKYKNKRYQVIVLENVVVYVNPKIYNEIFNEYSDDERLHYYNTTDISTLLNDNDESSMIKGKVVVDVLRTEQNFRRVLFDNGYNTLQNKKVISTQNIEQNTKQDFDLDFPIKNEFEHLDFSGIK